MFVTTVALLCRLVMQILWIEFQVKFVYVVSRSLQKYPTSVIYNTRKTVFFLLGYFIRETGLYSFMR